MSHSEKFKNEMMCAPNEEVSQVRYFLQKTEARLRELEEKRRQKDMTRAEILELSLCKVDIKRAKEFLSGKTSNK